MATATSTTALTLLDMAKRVDPDGKIPVIAEMLTQTNEVLQDMPWVEGNLPTGHRSTIRTGLPEATWRMINYGVQPDKSTTTQVVDSCGMLEHYSEVDKSLATLNGNTAAFRASEDRPFLDSLNNSFCEKLFYGNTNTSPQEIMGFSSRYDGIGTDSTLSTYNVLDGSGSGSDNTSIWLIAWGRNTAFGIYPKGSKVGIQHTDLGEVTLEDAAGGKYQGYRTHYKWDCGLAISDWRYAVRIANIDVSDLTTFGADTDNSANLIRLMLQATYRLPNKTLGRPVFYCNKTIRTWLDIMAMEKTNVQLTINSVAGKPQTEILGIPIKTCDALLNTEDTVS